MQLLDGGLVLSATDLVGYLACDHLATLELGRVAGLWERPHRRDDPTIEIIQAKGDLHEADYLARLRADGLTVVEIDKGDLRTREALEAAAAETLAAMRDGADVVYQATFFDGRWRGHADFLFKRDDRPSPALGGWSYDVADTKLARAVKAGAVLQLCVYAAQLEAVQGIAPEFLHVVTGDRTQHTLRTDEFAAYFRYVRARFEARIEADAADPVATTTYPDPVDHCRVCAWSPTCIQRRRDDDHLSIVAGMRRVDTERLVEAGIGTLTALATIDPATDVDGIPAPILARLHHQARLQLHERRTRVRVYELIEPDPAAGRRGLAMLPEPSPWDVFFDIEADPWATDDGLEYLLGVTTIDTGEPVYRAIWGTDRTGEGVALAEFLRFVDERLDTHPDLHVYHYGGYESGAIKRLIARHGRGAESLDRLLRGDVLVDLLNVVRQGVRASVESYSLKQIEKFYMPVRSGPVTEAGFSVVEFERWMRERDAAILDGIAAYNRDDCESTWRLRDWLEARRTEAIERWPERDWSRPVLADGAPSQGVAEWAAKVAERVAALTDGLAPEAADEESRARRLLADLLDWHRREEKQQWWRWFELIDDLTVEQLVGERDALAGLEFVEDLPPDGRRLVRRYRFEPQDHPIRPGDKPIDRDTKGEAGEVLALDDVRGTIDLARGGNREWTHPVVLLGSRPIESRAMREALLRIADDVIAHGFGEEARYPAAAQILLRRPPRIIGSAGGPLSRPDEDVVDAARRLGSTLDRTVLPIQGPPGTGKTYTAARMITALVRAGRRVGVTAQSHKTITNLLEEVVVAAARESTRVRIVQKADALDAHLPAGADVVIGDNKAIDEALATGTADVVAGTVWLHARNQLDALANGGDAPWLDVLFVDEAGQMSLANLLAASTAARSLVLVGDPNQLPMVSQGVHPPGAEASSLQHLVGGSVTVPPDRGLFLEQTRRLHPDVNAFISDAFYGGRLQPHPDTDRIIDGPSGALAGSGLRWWPVEHTGNGPRSSEEAGRVADALEAIIGRDQVLADGSRRTIGIEDVIVVAPYNAQVAEIQGAVEARLGRAGNVGTVDKFQGREGAVAIYSMASSSRDDAPRDMGFLYSRNRLNVAVSRAQSIAIVIGAPRLLEAGCRTPEQMRLVDALCRFVEVAEAQAARPVEAEPPRPG